MLHLCCLLLFHTYFVEPFLESSLQRNFLLWSRAVAKMMASSNKVLEALHCLMNKRGQIFIPDTG